MKEEIDNIIRQMHTDMGYPFMCVQEEEIPVAVNRIHKAFIQAQINLLSDLQINDNSCMDSGYIDYKISQLKDQLK